MATRRKWYFCPHREGFLVQGRHTCPHCDPMTQEERMQLLPAPRLGGALRAIFPILSYTGMPLSESAALAS